MVYCGKPSKGCSNCRERKIRCDQKEPGCGQCEKRQQRCPGYRNLVDLMFRNESRRVIAKANKARARKKAANPGASGPATPTDSEGRLSLTPEPRTRTLSLIVPPTPVTSSPGCRDGGLYDDDDDGLMMSPESGSWPVTPPMALEYNLAPACQERGVAYFFSRYVTADETVLHQKFDFLPDVWKPSSSLSERQVDGVLASMTAVGLMGLASTTRSPELMKAASMSYGTALCMVALALKDDVEILKDSTMLSVLILGVYEMMAENPSRTLTAKTFQDHVNGAAEIARRRGPAQFRSRAGRRMFSMLCQRVVISCAQRNMPMPGYLIELWHEMSRTSDPQNPDKRLMPLLWEVLQLRYEINNARTLTDPATIVNRLLAIDHEFEALTTTQLPPSWKCRTYKLKQPHPAVLGGICHLHASLHHATVWTHILTTRILLLETVLATISELLSSSSTFTPTTPVDDATRYYLDEYHRARRKLRHLVRDVAAAVPQLLGLLDPVDGTIDDDGGGVIATVEIVETPSPPTSPASARSSADSVGSVSVAGYSPLSATTVTSEPFSPLRRRTQRHFSSASCSSAAASPRVGWRLRGGLVDARGLTVLDVTGAGGDAEMEAERYMLLASATSSVVWPLFVVGMSTVAGGAGGGGSGGGGKEEGVREYVVGRLRTVYMETGIWQADAVAGLLEEEMQGGREEDDRGLLGVGAGGDDGDMGVGMAGWVGVTMGVKAGTGPGEGGGVMLMGGDVNKCGGGGGMAVPELGGGEFGLGLMPFPGDGPGGVVFRPGANVMWA